MQNHFSIIGFGKSGVGAVKFLLAKYPGAKIRVSDMKTRESFTALTSEIRNLEKQKVEFEFAKQSIDFITFKNSAVDKVFVMLSPGIPPKSPLIQDLKAIEKQGSIVLGTDFDIFTENLAEDQEYIAITGTNGKTTTTSLIAHILGNEAVGNIGKPFLDFDSSKYIACEISSFQLFHSRFPEDTAKLPKAALHLNLTDDHLDWHADLNEYKEAKAKLFQCSTEEENFLIFNYDDLICRKLAQTKIQECKTKNSKSRVAYFSTKEELIELDEVNSLSAYLKDNTLYIAKYLEPGQDADYNGLILTANNGNYILEIPVIKTTEINLVGMHNYSNMLAAILGTFVTGMDLDLIIEKLKSFTAVAHRLEYICTIDEHRIFNDSKATNPDSAEKALESFAKSIIIVGGKDKYLDLNPFFDLLTEKAYAVVAIGELKDSFNQGLKARNFKNIFLAKDLQEAFTKCLELGQGNDYPIILSPASSSFDMFSGYEERGNVFREIVSSYYNGTRCNQVLQ